MSTDTELRWALALMAEKGDASAPANIVTLSRAMAAGSPVLFQKFLAAWHNCMRSAELTPAENVRFSALLEAIGPDTGQESDRFNMRLDSDDKAAFRAIMRRTGESRTDIVSRLLRQETQP